jgi:hypothetical protein
MAKQAVARAIDLDPIDRLEDKIKLLVNVVTGLRADQAKTIGSCRKSMRCVRASPMPRAPAPSSTRSARSAKPFDSAWPRCSRIWRPSRWP